MGSNLCPVSVVIPSFNCGPFIREAVESVLNQTLPPLEVIIIDDGSTDDTAVRLHAYQDRIRYVRQERQGVSTARNHGLRLARGELIAFLDADDLFLPNKLEGQVALLRQHPRAGFIHSGWLLVDAEGRRIREVTPWVCAPKLDLKTWLMWKPAFLGAILFRRTMLERVGGFDLSLRHAEDVDLLLRLASLGCQGIWLKHATVAYRRHDHNTTHLHVRQAQGILLVLDRFFAQPGLPRRIRRLNHDVRYYTLLWVAWQFLSEGLLPHGIEALRSSLEHTTAPMERVILDWQGQLAKWLLEHDRSLGEVKAFWPYFKVASALDDQAWEGIEGRLHWAISVWWPSVIGSRLQPAPSAPAFRGSVSEEVIELILNSLRLYPWGPGPLPLGLALRFLNDAAKAVPTTSWCLRRCVMALLRVSLEAAKLRQWSLACHALQLAFRRCCRWPAAVL